MSELKTVTAREANQRFAKLLREVEAGGRGYVVTKRGKPVARIVPVETKPRQLTPEQEAALARLMATHWNLGIGKFDRDELYDRI